MTGIYILIGGAIGALAGYFIARWNLLAAFVPKQETDQLREQIRLLEQENAARLPKEEIERNYVHRELAGHYLTNIQELQERLKDAEWAGRQQQEELLRLTRESEQKVPKSIAAQKDQELLQLQTALTAANAKETALNEKLELFHKELDKLHQFSQERFKTLATEILEQKSRSLLVKIKRNSFDTRPLKDRSAPV